MNIASRICAAHIFFAREGAAFTLPAPGTVGREAKPDGPDAAWVRVFGNVEDLSVSPNEEFKKIIVAVPGRRVPWDNRKVMQETQIKFTAQEVGPFAVELFTGAGPMTPATTQFNPSAGTTKRGWLKVQVYDSDDAMFLAWDSFGVLKAEGDMKFGADFVKPQITFDALYSTLETAVV